MIRRYIKSSLLMGVLLCFAFSSSAVAQDLRADGTVYLRAGIGATSYHGDRDMNADDDISQVFDDQVGFPGINVELGYSGMLGPLGGSIGVRYLGGDYELVSHNPDFLPSDQIPTIDVNDSSFWRHNIGLVGRLNILPQARISPYLQAGAGATFGYLEFQTEGTNFGVDGDREASDGWQVAFSPMVGAGFDIALTNRIGLFLEWTGYAGIPDFALDASEGVREEHRDFDWFNFAGGGLRFNFQEPFAAVQVIALDGPTQLETNESGTFTATVNEDEATPPLEYEWDFGDGTTDTGLMATHSFDQAGTYTVTFTATNPRSEDSQTMEVTVEDPPVPAEIITINASPNPADVGEEVSFTSNIQGDEPIECQWDFGDGNTSTDCNPTHTYDEEGEYEVTLEASNETGADSRSLTMVVQPEIPAICAEITELNSAFFDRNSSTLTADARASLDENIEILDQCPDIDVRLEGFAARGERNPDQLSEDRARAVEEYYLDNNIEANRITVEAMGAEGDLTTKKDADEQFRRVDSIPVRDGVDLDENAGAPGN